MRQFTNWFQKQIVSAIKRLNDVFKKWLKITGLFQQFFRLLKAAAVLAPIWYGFMFLTKSPNPPTGTTPALIMVWVSGMVLILFLFPNIIDKVKKIKFKDFEIELTELKTVYNEELFELDITNYLSTPKEGFESLVRTLRKLRSKPGKKILLVVNISRDDYISIPMLLIYLFFLEKFSETTVLFISQRQNKLQRIHQRDVYGVASGQKIINKMYNIRHELSMIHYLYLDTYIERQHDPQWFYQIYHQLSEYFYNGSEFLSKHIVDEQFDDILSTNFVNEVDGHLEADQLYRSFQENVDYVIVTKEDLVLGVVSIADISKNISKIILSNIRRSKA